MSPFNDSECTHPTFFQMQIRQIVGKTEFQFDFKASFHKIGIKVEVAESGSEK